MEETCRYRTSHYIDANITMYCTCSQIGGLSGVRREEFPVMWEEVTEMLLRLGGHEVRFE